jgi:hypothetical protein
MATRSRIAVEIEGGKVLSVYCHNDGYLEGVGEALINLFPNGTDPKEVKEYIKEGDRSTAELSYKEWRDEDCPPQKHDSVPDFFDGDIEEYGYLYTQEGEWLVKSAHVFPNFPVTVEYALNGDEEDEDEEDDSEE